MESELRMSLLDAHKQCSCHAAVTSPRTPLCTNHRGPAHVCSPCAHVPWHCAVQVLPLPLQDGEAASCGAAPRTNAAQPACVRGTRHAAPRFVAQTLTRAARQAVYLLLCLLACMCYLVYVMRVAQFAAPASPWIRRELGWAIATPSRQSTRAHSGGSNETAAADALHRDASVAPSRGEKDAELQRDPALPPQSPTAQPPPQEDSPWESPAVLVIAYNRPDYLQRTLTSLLALPDIGSMPVYVSQDGHHAETAAVARSFAPRVVLWQRQRVPDPRSALGPAQPGTAFLAQHYRHALDAVFVRQRHSHAIIVEDDMQFAPDFLALFRATAPLLRRDPTLWCVSSWNDNGFQHLDLDEAALFRTGYFPGLGWLMQRSLWDELAPKWPLDHWVRPRAHMPAPAQRAP